MTSDDPWRNLSPDGSLSGPNARRVSAELPWDYFWARDGDGRYLLVLRHAAPVLAVSELPHLRGIEVLPRPVSADRPALVFRLLDSQQRDIFRQLCEDIVAAGAHAASEMEAVRASVRRTWRWHHLLRGGTDRRLSPEEQKGLIGELHVLRTILLARLSARDALTAWVGPLGAAKDFEIGTLCIEAKARRGTSNPHVMISSELQLDPGGCSSLYLHVTDVAREPAGAENGRTLHEHVAEVIAAIGGPDAPASDRLEQLLLAAGYRPDDDYSDCRWSIGETRIFTVGEEFPRITASELVQGVTEVRYSVALSACEPFVVDPEELRITVGAVNGD